MESFDFWGHIVGAMLTVLIYFLPVVIYRYVIRRRNMEKKNAIIFTVIYFLIACPVMTYAKYCIQGYFDGLSSGAITVWCFINYAVLRSGSNKIKATHEDIKHIGSHSGKVHYAYSYLNKDLCDMYLTDGEGQADKIIRSLIYICGLDIAGCDAIDYFYLLQLGVLVFEKIRVSGVNDSFVKFIVKKGSEYVIDDETAQRVEKYLKRNFSHRDYVIEGAPSLTDVAQTQITQNIEYTQNLVTDTVRFNTVTDSDIAFCRKCGAKLRDDSNYCSKCGFKARD